MVFNRIKAAVGRALPRTRLADDDDASTPEQEIDMDAWGAASTPGLGERLRRRARTFAVFGLGGVALAIFLFLQARQFAVGLVTNTYIQLAVAFAGVFAVGFLWGTKHQRRIITDTDWLIPMTGSGASPMPGEYRTATDGTEVFLPFKGFDFLGFKSRHLQLRELGESIARVRAKSGRDPEDPARIRLDDCRTEVGDTAFGQFIAADSDGFRHDKYGQHSDAFLSPPSAVSEENYKQLRDQLQTYAEQEVPSLEKQLEAVRQERDNLRGELKQSGDDAVDEFIERMAKLTTIQQEQAERMSGHSDNGDEPTIQQFEKAAKENRQAGGMH